MEYGNGISRVEPLSGDLQVIVNGIAKEKVSKNTIIDFGWFVKSIASREGIKNFVMKVDGQPISHNDLNKININSVREVELSTFDVARK